MENASRSDRLLRQKEVNNDECRKKICSQIALKVLRKNYHEEKAGPQAERINTHGPNNSEVCS